MTGFSEDQLDHDGLRRVYGYWLGKKGDRPAPSRTDIRPEELAPLLPNLYLVDVEGTRFRLRLVGTEIVQEYGAEITGRYLDEIDLDDHKADILHEYLHATRDCAPQFHQWDYEKDDGRQLRYSRLILPLSSDGQTVDKLLCAAFVRRFRPSV